MPLPALPAKSNPYYLRWFVSSTPVIKLIDIQPEDLIASRVDCLAVALSSKLCKLTPQLLYDLRVSLGDVFCLAWVVLKVI